MAPKRSREEALDGLSNEEILSIVREIVTSNGTTKEKMKTFSKSHPSFAERYPALLEMACAPNFDMQRLEYMLNLRGQIQSKARTVEDASIEVGQVLFNEYVKPNINE